MTKEQSGPSARTRLTPAAVVEAAMGLLDEEGLEAVTTRAVADRLGVRMNTVLWHVKTKSRLLELMADAVAGAIAYDDLPAEAGGRARELMRRYRQSLLAHRDGAALVTGTYAAEPHTLRFADTLIATLTEHLGTARAAARTLYALVYFTLGLTQEEQAVTNADEPRLREAVAAGPYPALRASQAALAEDTFPARFEDGVQRILGRA
ncbi:MULTISPECIES: TetR/AcrR family transcriptional regulator C-terminal domain-containing protein [unclassified Streptomyces]|uniref:TetR/AcrR family transcriptional regulator C-terminal domain-containing protein n=1 Tax=unclassified Streptomyces TaxID=2593676 RepID=UPI002DD9D54D|nr:TetR/AcrR family transcriptional regulator C-terminal domain-containing protein [Streptomyces sp. NBC_01795]WSA96058.1 TetR/AcrR family transcriptional regulator C-terminal domain-containing protein [Streptomyces sp. NBC_01795]WSS40030.1 TetR/AcrR family transcriptional regulator C-terminal domain-containing protein [Streptomyces sp. NBC_01187]